MAEAPIARRLAGELAAIRDGALPPEVLSRARDLLRDFLGVAIGGAGVDSSVVLRDALGTLGVAGDGTVLGVARRLAPPEAALANGAAAHALEMDDTHQGGSIHLAAPVFPAALAAAELVGAGGEAVLRAAVGGYEVAARLAMALGPAAHYGRGFHPTGTCGTFGAAAAAGLALGLEPDALAAALGIAGSQAAGSMEFLADGAWTKRLHPGWAAAAGLHAAALARAGFRAPATVFEGRAGVLHAYSDGADPRPLLARDGWELMRTGIKPHACCRYMQGPIDAALALRRAHRFAVEDVERIEVGLLAVGFSIVHDPLERKRRPASVVDAQFSLPFGVAVALVRGSAGPDDFVPAAFAEDPRIRALMDRVVGVRDPALDRAYPRAWPAWLRLVLRDGRVLEQRVAHPLGDPENFPDAGALHAKFRALASRSLPAATIERLEAAIEAFAAAPRVTDLLAASVP